MVLALKEPHGRLVWIYAVAGLFSFFFVAVFIPETKGRTLEEIEALWAISPKIAKSTG